MYIYWYVFKNYDDIILKIPWMHLVNFRSEENVFVFR